MTTPKSNSIRTHRVSALAACALLLLCMACAERERGEAVRAREDHTGPRTGGRLVAALGAEPQTLNPAVATDSPSLEIIRRTTADLVSINRQTQSTETALAESVTVSGDGLRYTVTLRQGIRFSDGHPLDADDVLFTFQVLQDESVGSPSRDLLVVDEKRVEFRKIDSRTVEFTLDRPRAVGDRIFDSNAILPRHLLEDRYREGTLAEAWRLDTPPEQIAGLGPFRLKSYTPAQQLVLERNPYYWKVDGDGVRLPYLDEIVFVLVPSKDAQILRFRGGEIDIIDDLSAENFDILERQQEDSGYVVRDLGPGLRFNFLFFNLNELPADQAGLRAKQKWFKNKGFRKAIDAAIDREGIARLVYRGRATPIWSPVSPGNKPFFNSLLPSPPRSLDRARELLEREGFGWQGDALVDPEGRPVKLTIVTNSNNGERVQMMTVVQEDLRRMGIDVQVVALEFRALVARVLETKDYELCILGLAGGDADPNPLMNVLLSSGGQHLWNPSQDTPATAWEAEIDRLMKDQATELDYPTRKATYDRVQELMAENAAMIALASPHVLVGADSSLGNFKPAILQHYTLWNADELFWRTPASP